MDSTSTHIDPALHRHLLRAFLDPALSLPDMAEAHGLDLSDLVAWSADPEVAAQLDALEALAHRRLRALAAQHAPAAVQTLATLLTSPAPETARRAASALLRLLGKGPTPTPVRATSGPAEVGAPQYEHAAELFAHSGSPAPVPLSHLGGAGTSPVRPTGSFPPTLRSPLPTPSGAPTPGLDSVLPQRPDRPSHRILAAAGTPNSRDSPNG